MADIQVGATCVIERHYGHSTGKDKPEHSWSSVVVRVTPKRVYFAGGDWFALDDPKREVKPKYLDYRTFVVEVKPSPTESNGEGGSQERTMK